MRWISSSASSDTNSSTCTFFTPIFSISSVNTPGSLSMVVQSPIDESEGGVDLSAVAVLLPVSFPLCLQRRQRRRGAVANEEPLAQREAGEEGPLAWWCGTAPGTARAHRVRLRARGTTPPAQVRS
jgi:hypothetical protein